MENFKPIRQFDPMFCTATEVVMRILSIHPEWEMEIEKVVGWAVVENAQFELCFDPLAVS